MSEWQPWIGREALAEDVLGESLARRWCAAFDLALPEDGVMPQGIHFCLCTPDAPTGALGEDGHPLRDDSPQSFLPPVPLPRRMWASSSIAFHAPLAIRQRIARRSRILSVEEKSGRSGAMVFVEVEHETQGDGALAVREVQTLVYREAAAPDAPLQPPAPATAGTFAPDAYDVHRTIVPDPRLLFRYSALTFNTHRIHYDAPYATKVERYRGIVVHGPLTASLLLQLAARTVGENRLRHFAFRGLSPAIADEPLHLVARHDDNGLALAAFAADGRQVTEASARLAPG